jgi:prepilin-type N-terminal cleavage/methylation domain-containing protein
MLTRLRNLRTQHADSGFTLIEMLVTMVIAVTVGALTMRLVVMVNASASATSDRAVNSGRATSTIQAWSGYLAVIDDPTASGLLANRFEWFTPTSVLFYSDQNNRSGPISTTRAPTMIWLRLDGSGQLVEEQFPAQPASYPAGWTTCRSLLTDVTQAALFTAYDASGNDITALNLGTAPAVGNGCQKLPAAPPSQGGKSNATVVANLQNVASVRIAFTVLDHAKGHPLNFSSTVALPRLGAPS